MTVRRLLKSWAMAPASWPIAPILLICRAERTAEAEVLPFGGAKEPSRPPVLVGGLASCSFLSERRAPDNRDSADTTRLSMGFVQTARQKGGKSFNQETNLANAPTREI